MCLALWETVELPPKVSVPFCISISKERDTPLFNNVVSYGWVLSYLGILAFLIRA